MHFRVGHAESAETLIKAFHYSRRMPANIQFCGTMHEDGGLFGDFGPAVAAILFTIPPTRWGEPVWELARLVRHDKATISLTGLISKAVKEITKRKAANLLVSFADYTQGHHGGIYQAASWNYSGKRTRAVDGCLIDGVFWPGRSLNSRYGTRSPTNLKDRLAGRDVEPHWDEGKFLYWKPLTKEGRRAAARLGLECLPYPKPHTTEAATA